MLLNMERRYTNGSVERLKTFHYQILNDLQKTIYVLLVDLINNNKEEYVFQKKPIIRQNYYT